MLCALIVSQAYRMVCTYKIRPKAFQLTHPKITGCFCTSSALLSFIPAKL